MMLYFTLENDIPIQIRDKNLRVETVAEGLSSPTSMDFIDNNNILVLEKDKGIVRLVSLNGTLSQEPALKLNVDTKGERGLLGIATKRTETTRSDSNSTFATKRNVADEKGKLVFVYFTGSSSNNNNVINNTTLKNRIYSYDWNREKLVNPRLILDLPAEPGPYHQGGKLKVGTDNKNLYAVIGDLTNPNGVLQNFREGKKPDNTSSILQIQLDNNNSMYTNSKSNLLYTTSRDTANSTNYSYEHYAYGIRNSFGIEFDPVTGILWDTENGEYNYDEINIVKPGFNSGWAQVMGPISRNDTNKIINNLVSLTGSAYADPVFSWKEQIGVTDIEFLNSTKFGSKYANNIFVGDINNGNLYYFEVNDNRSGLNFSSVNNGAHRGLEDSVADSKEELSQITFGTGFGRITDLETGPDGFLYILTYEDGKIYRIVPGT
jgi:aldose sugar dehydrogenase